MSAPCEYTLAEKPAIEFLRGLGYGWLGPAKSDLARDGLNNVLLRDECIAAIQRINDVPEDVARAVYHELLGVTDNERWASLLRGNYSRTVPGEATKKTIHLVDFLHPEKNTFTVTNQFTVNAERTHRADIVLFVNGIPVVVIEAKNPVAGGDKANQAFDQIKQYERDIPRLFYSNAFSIVTDGRHVIYGTTGAPSEFWAEWKDPWPRKPEDFPSAFEQGLWSLLEPSRLLDILAHFIVFEKRETQVCKKMCRYQQFRAVNRMVQRVVEGKHRRGLIWHTQGSGKSLTMAFATLKLKTHRTLECPELTSPNILVLTDRINLDNQIAGTFQACGLPNPVQIESVDQLRQEVHRGTTGLTLLSTIFKFEGSKTPVANSENWIVLVDECHRTQEKNLGAFLRATLKDAWFFGFTGTPIKKTDHDTYANFGIVGETYLDRYSIDDAVADGATVPVQYTSRRAEWQVDPAKLDILFDQWFENDERKEAIKKRGVTLAELAKHPERVRLIAYDIWEHFKAHAMPDGFKAQVVAIDREALILYKRALDGAIAEDLIRDGVPEPEARDRAARMTAGVYSGNQEDAKPSEDPYLDDIRKDLVRFLVVDQDERNLIDSFLKSDTDLKLVIVVNKLLTGFDAPIESVMYLDSPLKDHSLLQAIARTNRPCGPHKEYGLIVDYIGVTRNLDEALASYHDADVKNAMVDLESRRSELRSRHAEVKQMMNGARKGTKDVRQQYDALIVALGTVDQWFRFRRRAKAFIKAYEALSPDPVVLDYREDLKFVAGFLTYGAQAFEKREGPDLRSYSAKIREMLEQHLHVTGIATVCKLRNLSDPEFWKDFTPGKKPEDLKLAAIRKSTELKKILREKVALNPFRYEKFSDRVLEVLQRFEQGLLTAAELLKANEEIARDLKAEDEAHVGSGLTETAYGILRILEALPRGLDLVAEAKGTYGDSGGLVHDGLGPLAKSLDDLYSSNDTAPAGWHLKNELRKELRQKVRQMGHEHGMKDLMTFASQVEDFALKHHVRMA